MTGWTPDKEIKAKGISISGINVNKWGQPLCPHLFSDVEPSAYKKAEKCPAPLIP
jgi:hypothetical protein